MIFLTVGTQFNFDRLVKFVDEYAASVGLVVKAQVGKSNYFCKAIQAEEFLTPDQIDILFSDADVIVSHAGMGSIINAMRLKKPIIIFPRLASNGEHRNNHQLDTLNSFDGVQGVYCARSKEELLALLSRYKQLEASAGLMSDKSVNLSAYIKSTFL